MDKRAKTVFQAGDLIFAKMKSFPPWPAKILDKADYPLTPVNKLPVVFYGTNELGYMRQQDIFDFEEFRDKFGVAKKLKGFNEGLAEAEAELNNDVAISVEIKEDQILPEPTLQEQFIEQDKTPDASKRARKPPKSLADFLPTSSARKRKGSVQTSASTPKSSKTVDDEISMPFSIDHMKDEPVLIEPPVSVVSDLLAPEIVPSASKTSTSSKLSKQILEPPNDFNETVDASMSNTIEQLKNELESGVDNQLSVLVIDNEPIPEIAPKSSKKSKLLKVSDQFLAGNASPEIVKKSESIFDQNILTEKRIRKKKTFSDDFISPDFIFGTPKQPKTPSAKSKKTPLIHESAESSESEGPKNLIIDESPHPPPTPVVVTTDEPVAKVAPLRIKLPPSKKTSKQKIQIVQPKLEETFDTDSEFFAERIGEKQTPDYFPSRSSYASESSTTASSSRRPPKLPMSPVVVQSTSTKPKKFKPKLKINLQLKSTTQKLKKKLMLPRPAPFKTSSKIKWREGESEEDYKRRRRIQNRMSKQNYKMRKLFVTAYSFWSAIEMEKLLKDQPDLMDFQSIRLVLQSKWRNLSNEEKEKYRMLAKKEKQKRFALFSTNQPNVEAPSASAVEKPPAAEKKLLVKIKTPKIKQAPSVKEPVKIKNERNYFEAAEEFTSPSTSKMMSPLSSLAADLPETLPLAPSEKKSPPARKIIDRDTNAVITRRPTVGPVEARSRWWLFSNGGATHRRKRGGKKENSPPRGLTSELLDNVAIFRLMSKSFEQMGNRLLKLNENNNTATGAFVDSLLDGFLLTLVQLLSLTRAVHPSNQCYPKEKVLDLVEKTAFLTPL